MFTTIHLAVIHTQPSQSTPYWSNGSQINGALNVNGTTYLPLKAVGQALGADVSWTGDSVEIETVDIEALKEALTWRFFNNSWKATTQGGVYIDYDEVLTAYHVIDGYHKIRERGRRIYLHLRKDKAIDVALLKPKANLSP